MPQTLQTDDGVNIILEDAGGDARVDPETGATEIDLPDGGVVVQFAPNAEPGADEGDPDEDHFENLADDMDDTKLGVIAEDLIQAVEADDQSRSQSLADRARGIDLLGIHLAPPRSDVADASAPIEGMSSVTNPLMLSAILKGWANAQAELLPSGGPTKVQDEGDINQAKDELAETLERDMNWYLTKGAPEYYPDTSHMLLWGVYFGGSGIKKVYRCPLRRRPVSDSVDIKDFIVSDTTKDLGACERITHQQTMRRSVVKRMQMLGAYREVDLGQPVGPKRTAIEEAVGQVQGTAPNNTRPEDLPYTIWEIQCELVLDEYAPAAFKKKGIALPFTVVLEKDSRKVLALRRDWSPDDEDCMRKRLYVKYPYVPGPGFYGTGLLNILGNASAAMTAAWREALDAGMFANFPTFMYAKLLGRQNTSDLRVAPGTGIPIDTNGQPIGTVVAHTPYQDVTAGLMAMIDKITSQAKEAGGMPDMPTGEGIQNVPVGTVLASIEEATKVMAAAHKGMHTAQSEELGLLVDLFRETPEDFWRGNKKAKQFWNEQKLLQALETISLVPRSDPNVPSHIHRILKAWALTQVGQLPMFMGKIDANEALQRVLAALQEDPRGLVIPPSPQAPPPPPLKDQADMIEAEAKQQSAQNDQAKLQLDAATHLQDAQNKTADRESQERMKTMELAGEMVIHSDTHGLDKQSAQHKQALDAGQQILDAKQAGHEHALDVHTAQTDAAAALTPPEPAARARGGRVGRNVARRAKDGKFYLPDPARPGKYLMVVEHPNA